MSPDKVGLEEAIRLGFGEPTMAVKLPVLKGQPRVKKRTGLKVIKPRKEQS